MSSVEARWLAYGDDGSMTTREVADEVGCSQSYVCTLREQYGVAGTTRQRSIRDRWLAMEDDGSQPAWQVSAELGCSTAYVEGLRRRREHRLPDPERVARCTACTAFGDEQVPIVTPAVEARLREVMAIEVRECADGLCLWCWMGAQGLDPRELYETGAWERVIEWRPKPSAYSRFREDLRAVMRQRNATYQGVAEATGLSCYALYQFSAWQRIKLEPDELEALCLWAGLSVADYDGVVAG